MAAASMTAMAPARSHWQRYRLLYLMIAVAIAPVVASYFFFYVMPPSGRVNYGALLEPRPVPAVPATTLEGERFDFRRIAGQWTMVMVDDGRCPQTCVEKLFQLRQQQAMAGRDSGRVARLWLITDDASVPSVVLNAYQGTHMVRVTRADAERLLLVSSENPAPINDHLWLIDPMGNLMLRWPAQPDPAGVKRDLSRLLRASAHWVRIERKS